MRYVVDDPTLIINDFESTSSINVSSLDLSQGNLSNPRPAGEVETFVFAPTIVANTARRM